MSRVVYIFLSFVSMLLVGLLSFTIGYFGGGYFSFIPLIIWFIIMQIFIVPRLLKKK